MERVSHLENVRWGKRWPVAALALVVVSVAPFIVRDSLVPTPVARSAPPPIASTATSRLEPAEPLPSSTLTIPAPLRESASVSAPRELAPHREIELPLAPPIERQRSGPLQLLQPSRSLTSSLVASPTGTSTAVESAPATEAHDGSSAPPDRETAIPELNSELRAVGNVLELYRQLYVRLDASAAAAIWPQVDAQALMRTFAQLERQNLSFDECSVTFNDRTATAHCVGVLEYVPRIGRNRLRTERHTWTIELFRASEGWQIVKVEAR